MSRRHRLLPLLLLAGLTATAVATDPAWLALVVSSETHPAAQNDFDHHHRPWAGRPLGQEPPAVDLRLVPWQGRGQVLRVTNRVPGGFVGIDLQTASEPGPLYSLLAFDYRAAADLKVNLFAKVRHQDYEIGLTGPPSDTGEAIWLGEASATAASADGWRRLEIPLAAWIRGDQQSRRPLRLSELSIGNRHQGDYLLAGFGGNPMGATLEVDNFVMLRHGPADAVVRWAPVAAVEVAGYSVVLDRRPATEPRPQITTTADGATFGDLAEGTHWLHVRAQASDGVWGPTTHFRLEVDRQPPVVTNPRPATGAAACPAIWQCALADRGVGVNPGSIDVLVANQLLSVHDEAVTYQPRDGELAVNLASLGLTLKAGEPVKVTVSAADDNDVAMPEPFVGSFVYTPAKDTDPPLHPRLEVVTTADDVAHPLPGEGTFEHGLDEWTPFGRGGTVVQRTDETAAAGRYSLKLTCTENASPFSVFVRRTPFDASRYRVISFDYKVTDRLRVDFLLRFEDQLCRVRFTDRDQDAAVIGEVPGVIADNQWRHAQFDLYEMLRARYPRARDFTVGMLLLTGGPWRDAPRRFPGNYAGTTYYIDNFHLVPTLGVDTVVHWRADEMVGIAGAEVASAATLAELTGDTPPPTRRLPGGQLNLTELTQGLIYLWARLYDHAGNLSEPLITRLRVNATRPRVGAISPAPGSRVAPSRITVELQDGRGQGLEAETIRLEVAGRTYDVDNQVLSYHAEEGLLVWDGRRAAEPVVFTDGQEVAVALLEARDQAGNRPTELPAWTFVMDYAQDQRGPLVEVESPTHAAYFQEAFNDPVTGWLAAADSATELDQPADERQAGGRTLRIRSTGGAYAAGYRFEQPFAASRFGLLAFEYRFPAGVEVDLLVEVRTGDGSYAPRALRLTDTATDLKQVGQVQQVVADGTWRQAIVPLYSLLRTDETLPMPYVVRAIGFGDRPPSSATAGTGIEIDNLFIFRRASSRNIRLRWRAFDETGVTGYSYLFDRNPRAEPPAEVMTTETELRGEQAEPGVTFFHIRARDGAGNWGPTAHFLLVTPER